MAKVLIVEDDDVIAQGMAGVVSRSTKWNTQARPAAASSTGWAP